MADDTMGMSREMADKLAAARIERELAEAEAARSRSAAECHKLALEARRFETAERFDAFRMEEAEWKMREWRAGDGFYRIYYFSDGVTEVSATRCMGHMDLWDRLDEDDGECRPMTIIFNSPGGDVIAGMALFDHIQSLRRKGHRITTGTEGVAASMAGILLQAGDTRFMGKEAWVLIHEAAFGTSGKTFQVEDRVEWVKRVQERILDIFANRAKEAGANGTASHPMGRAQFKKNWNRKDWWLSSDECLKYGIVDEVR